MISSFYSYIFVNGVEIYKQDSEINATPLWLGNVSTEFADDGMRKAGLYRYVYDFSVDRDSIIVIDILDIHKCLIIKNNIKCSGLLNKCFLCYCDLNVCH